MSAATRERVLDAARELDYVPLSLARGLLKSQLARLVAVIVHDIRDYFAEIVRGVEDAASPAGYLVITCSSEREARRESSAVRLLRQLALAAAVIFAGSGLDDAALNAEFASRPRRDARARCSDRPSLAVCRGRAARSALTTSAAWQRWLARWSAWATAGSLPGRSAVAVRGSAARLAGRRQGLADAGIAY